jgi:recombination protein RecR
LIQDWFDDLVGELSRLPGIGRRTAARLAFALLDNRDLARNLSDVLRRTFEQIHECPECRNLTDLERCPVCADPSRTSSLCVVENVADLRSIDDAGLFRGRFFVLHGLLAPLDGVGPTQLGIEKLASLATRLQSPEVILALDATADGEATCSWLGRTLECTGARITRLARGLPSGASVEMIDSGTLIQAFEGRQKV